MIKFLFVGRRAAGRTRAATLAHLRDVHGRMVVCPPADAGAMPVYYVQNHVIDGAYPVGEGAHAIERDLVTQLEFESMDAMRAAVETNYYRDNLRPDEPRFVDDATVARLNVVPRFVVEGPRTEFKTFIFVSRAPKVDDAVWKDTRSAIAAAIAGLSGVAAVIENDVLPPSSGPRFVDIVFEAWFEARDSALAAAATAIAMFDTTAVDRTTSLTIVAEEFTKERLKILLGCH